VKSEGAPAIDFDVEKLGGEGGASARQDDDGVGRTLSKRHPGGSVPGTGPARSATREGNPAGRDGSKSKLTLFLCVRRLVGSCRKSTDERASASGSFIPAEEKDDDVDREWSWCTEGKGKDMLKLANGSSDDVYVVVASPGELGGERAKSHEPNVSLLLADVFGRRSCRSTSGGRSLRIAPTRKLFFWQA